MQGMAKDEVKKQMSMLAQTKHGETIPNVGEAFPQLGEIVPQLGDEIPIHREKTPHIGDKIIMIIISLKREDFKISRFKIKNLTYRRT